MLSDFHTLSTVQRPDAAPVAATNRRRPVRLAASATALAAALLLTGCTIIETAASAGDDLGDDAPVQTDGDTPETAPGSDGNGGYQAIDLGTPPTDMTAPGTQLGLGEAAWVSVNITDDAGVESTQPFGISVLDIVEGDVSFFDQYSNAEDFADNVPYFIVAQQTRPEQTGVDEVSTESFWPVLADGENADLLTQFGMITSGACKLDLPELDTTTGTTVSCVVALGTPDNPVTQVVYDGMGQYSIFYDEDDIYAENPIVWS